MSSISPAQAAKAFKVSRTTLMKAIEKGKISAEKDGRGYWMIDTSELARVYEARGGEQGGHPPIGNDGQADPSPEQQPVSASSETESDLSARLAVAEAELRAEREKNDLLTRHLEDVRRMLPAPETPPRRRFWPF